MNWLLNWLYNNAIKAARKAALREIGELELAINDGDDTTVELAKQSICRVIQDQRKVPGTLRGILCDGIKAISGTQLAAWLNKAEAAILKW